MTDLEAHADACVRAPVNTDLRLAAWSDRWYVPALTKAITQHGTMVVAACGNDGARGPFLTDNSITPPHMISVGAAGVCAFLPAALLQFNQAVDGPETTVGECVSECVLKHDTA